MTDPRSMMLTGPETLPVKFRVEGNKLIAHLNVEVEANLDSMPEGFTMDDAESAIRSALFDLLLSSAGEMQQ